MILVLMAVAAAGHRRHRAGPAPRTEQGSHGHSPGTGPGTVVTEGTEPATEPGTTPVTETPPVPGAGGLGDLRNATYPRTLCPDANLLPPAGDPPSWLTARRSWPGAVPARQRRT